MKRKLSRSCHSSAQPAGSMCPSVHSMGLWGGVSLSFEDGVGAPQETPERGATTG